MKYLKNATSAFFFVPDSINKIIVFKIHKNKKMIKKVQQP